MREKNIFIFDREIKKKTTPSNGVISKIYSKYPQQCMQKRYLRKLFNKAPRLYQEAMLERIYESFKYLVWFTMYRLENKPIDSF